MRLYLSFPVIQCRNMIEQAVGELHSTNLEIDNEGNWLAIRKLASHFSVDTV